MYFCSKRDYLNFQQFFKVIVCRFCSFVLLPEIICLMINFDNLIMLPIEKNNDIIEQIKRVISRADHIREVKDQLFNFINGVENLSSTFAQKINKEMTKFEEFVMKISLYYQKSDHIISLSKLYREFSLQIERNSKINLINIQKIKQESIYKQQEKLKSRCEVGIKQFDGYKEQQKQHNTKYSEYSHQCDALTQTINRYKSYQNPISFYNKNLTNEYLSELDQKHHDCSTSETKIITSRQMIDEKRSFLTENIKDVNEAYFLLYHHYLVTIETNIKCIVYPKNEERLDKTQLNLRNSDNIEQQHMMELHRLDNLYASDANKNVENNPFQEFSQLFKKSVNQFQINSDYRFFHDRCASVSGKKLKTSEETYKIQLLLVNELKQQMGSYDSYQKSYKQIEKDIFTNNGIESYKKRFRKYFGSNFAEIFELCHSLIERQKKSLEKICKTMQDSESKMRKILQSKKHAIDAFDRRSKTILTDHLKIKEKIVSGVVIDSEELNHFKSSIGVSFTELKNIFMQLQKSEGEDDKRFFSSLKNLYESIMKQATNKNLNKLLDKEKNRINILNSMNINHQILLILKEDSRYQSLLNQCPKPNLYSTFISMIKKKEVEETKILLQKKDQRLKSMIRPKQGCCGVKSEVIKINVQSQHDCKLRVQTSKYKGKLNITSQGLIFEESTWNPFAEGLQLIIPQTDIISMQLKTVNEKEAVEIGTDFGIMLFESQESTQMLQSMQKNITFRGVKEPSEQGGKRNDSSSFIKNNTSTEFKMSFDKSINSNGDISKVIKAASGFKQPQEKVTGKSKSSDNGVKDLIRKWKEAQFFPEERFVRLNKNPAEKNEMRKDYQYHHNHSKFYLKERRQYKMVQKDLVLKYEWKISFPDSPMLHSFKHHQQVRIENIAKQMRIRVIQAKYFEEQLYIKNKFYKEIEEMNKLVCQLVVYLLEKEATITHEQEYDERKSLESYNLVLDDINFEDRESKFEKTESLMRVSKVERNKSASNSIMNAKAST